MSKAEKNYSISELELLAAVWAMTYLRHLIYGRPAVVTDHHALCWSHSIKDHSRRLARWALKLAEFDYSVIYKKSSKHQDVDCLSRNPAMNVEDTNVEDLEDIPTFTISTVYIVILRTKN